MRRFLIALLVLAAAETAALACSCVDVPRDAARRQALARDIATGALALVEVELVTPYDRPGRGERLRVRRTLAGRAPAAFEVERDRPPISTACDLEFNSGERTLVLIYAPRRPAVQRSSRYRISSSCTTYLLADAAFRAAVVREWGRRR